MRRLVRRPPDPRRLSEEISEFTGQRLTRDQVAYRKRWPTFQVRLKRRFCKQNDLPFDITIEDIQIPEVCSVLGIKLNIGRANASKDDSPSIDRINHKGGYTKGNVAVISLKANRIKNNANLEELEKVYLWLKKQSTH